MHSVIEARTPHKVHVIEQVRDMMRGDNPPGDILPGDYAQSHRARSTG